MTARRLQVPFSRRWGVENVVLRIIESVFVVAFRKFYNVSCLESVVRMFWLLS